MKRVNLDNAHAQVRKFFGSLALKADGVALVMKGHVIGKLLPPSRLTEAEKKALIEQRMQLIRRAQNRRRAIPSRVTEILIREAVEEVRGGKQ
jgi:hypothetical protein